MVLHYLSRHCNRSKADESWEANIFERFLIQTALFGTSTVGGPYGKSRRRTRLRALHSSHVLQVGELTEARIRSDSLLDTAAMLFTAQLHVVQNFVIVESNIDNPLAVNHLG